MNPRGFTLVEVLVAVVILSLGLLALAALQSAGLKGSRGAALRTHATQLASAMAEQLRSDREFALSGGYALALDTPAVADTSAVAPWREALARALPSGRGRVEARPDSVTIVVEWEEPRAAEASGITQVTLRTRL